jgi:hypothetical protein
MTHASNPSYSGGRDEEDLGSEPAWANSSQVRVSKKTLLNKHEALSSNTIATQKRKKFTMLIAYRI